MLANNLNILLAERNLTIKQVVNDTGLSRNTVSNLINKPEGNISIETVDTLCNYLEVDPSSFFDYSPYIIDIELFNESVDSAFIVLNLRNGKKIQNYRFDLSLNSTFEKFVGNQFSSDVENIVDIGTVQDFENEIFNNLSLKFRNKIIDELKNKAKEFFSSHDKSNSNHIGLILQLKKSISTGDLIFEDIYI